MLVEFKLTNLIKSTIPVLNTLSVMKFVIKNHKKIEMWPAITQMQQCLLNNSNYRALSSKKDHQK